jgi:hypothetical protein
MSTASAHDFFTASAAVAGTLITHLLIERIQARRAPPEPGGAEEE